MTTKYKIISGFAMMIAILAGVAYLGYFDIQHASNSFNEYGRLVRFNVAMSDVESNMNATVYNLYRFVDEREDAYIDEARKAAAAVSKSLKDAEGEARRPETKKASADLDKEIQVLPNLLSNIQASMNDAQKQYVNGVTPSALEMTKHLKSMAEQARGVNNAEALLTISEVWSSVAAVRSDLSRYAISRQDKDAALVTQNLDQTRHNLEALKEHLHTAEGRQVFAGLMQSFGTLSDAFARMQTMYGKAATGLADTNKALTNLLRESHTLNENVDKQMRTFGNTMIAENESAQRTMLSVSSGGFVVGIAMATFIILGLVRVLNALAGFAGAVARGDFSYQLNIREKGEIGIMVDAMRELPKVLARVGEGANTLSNSILSGRFRDRMDTSIFQGSFVDLSKAVNMVGEAYTAVIDALPVPVTGYDKQHTTLFLNRAAQVSLGITSTGQKMQDEKLNSFGDRAVRENSPATGEVTIYPIGTRMDVAVTAMPLHDLQKQTVGYMAILTDLTEIRAKQTLMLQVAKDAADISDRVAAASEQLAAQVEQISRGAEMQRSRVESTASAMSEMNATVLEVARNAGQASQQSEDTRQRAEQGAMLVDKVVNAITTVNAVASTMQRNMQELGSQAESIGGVMSVISDIADQTNLLALNAAIEAARAGDAGRGFAVVADEVRKLAEKTMSATGEVGASISSIQHSARTSIAEMTNAAKGVSEATELANQSGSALKQIVDLAASNSAVVTSIATAAEEQSATSEEINHAIEEINLVVGETTEGMIQSSSAVQDLSRMAQDLRRVMEGLK